MLQQDYLTRMMVIFAKAFRQWLERRAGGGVEIDNETARENLEDAIGEAAEMDKDVLLALDPESMATILWMGSINDSVAEYIVHALMIDAESLDEDGLHDTAELRRQQAQALASHFGFTYDPDRLEALLDPEKDMAEAQEEEFRRQYGLD